MSTPTKSNTVRNEAPVTEPIASDEKEVIDMDALEEENRCQMQVKIAATKVKNDTIAKRRRQRRTSSRQSRRRLMRNARQNE